MKKLNVFATSGLNAFSRLQAIEKCGRRDGSALSARKIGYIYCKILQHAAFDSIYRSVMLFRQSYDEVDRYRNSGEAPWYRGAEFVFDGAGWSDTGEPLGQSVAF
jgi:hypothetical protein